MKILGFYSGHDASYAILDNGIPIIHNELERFTRKKGDCGDAYNFFKNIQQDEHIDYVVSSYRWNPYDDVKPNNIPYPYKIYSHHMCHASNAYYTSPYDHAHILCLDGSGYDETDSGMMQTSVSFWEGRQNKLFNIDRFDVNKINLGAVWHIFTTKIFKQDRGTEGTIMAMAAMGQAKYEKSIPILEPVDIEYWKSVIKTEQDKYDLAASLQLRTESEIRNILSKYINVYDIQNLCLSGGVALNCVMTAKIYDWFPSIKNIFVDPIPYDGGLSLGAARYLWHHELNNDKIDSSSNRSSYLGRKYNENDILNALVANHDKIKYTKSSDDDIINLINSSKIISVYGGGSESGRRALGNRSILADPRNPEIKNLINEKIKHRQSYRPFAPSILREEVNKWFTKDIDSPYMSFAVNFKDEVKHMVPAVLHLDDTGRLQTVTESSNRWYYNFIKKWYKFTDIPIILNTSFNDREPIVETPEHAINCFLNTNIDYLYFYDYNILVEKI